MGSMGIDVSTSEASTPTEQHPPTPAFSQKRSAGEAGLKSNGLRPNKSVKRRASKACQCCRARKVRCNVVEHGAPCTNCRLDEVECIVSESKRKKKWGELTPDRVRKDSLPKAAPSLPLSAAPPYEPLRRISEHVPHPLYQDLSRDMNGSHGSSDSKSSVYPPNLLMNLQRPSQKPNGAADPSSIIARLFSDRTPSYSLPAYIKPIPTRVGHDEIVFLEKKGALEIPPAPLRDALLQSFAEFVHPFMPLLNIHELVESIDLNDGSQTISLLLFQAVMFAGVATVDAGALRAAGYTNRRVARRAFFQKARFLYDFDYEVDRVALIQSLLLMTYWYETPDDQKDSYHWMGIAVSLSHTIGLHRDPENSTSIEPARRKLWRRIWWCTYMRDRLIALGMRRPTKIKSNDFDVPMLTLDDFEIKAVPERPTCVPSGCKVLRDAETQRRLAVMCIEKAKLCIVMSHVLSVQYSVLHNNHGAVTEEGSTQTTLMLVQNKAEVGLEEVEACDAELQVWRDALADEAQYVIPTHQDIKGGDASVMLNSSLLHMIYYATLSALHRPQVLPATGVTQRNPSVETVDISRKTVRLAAAEITNIATTLYKLDLVRNLPTTGITVLLPAIIIHLLDIKANDDATRKASLKGFCECMQILARLRDIYAAADYSTAFLEAAIRKAEISWPQKSEEMKGSRSVITSSQGLVDAGKRLHLVASTPVSGALTPPPEEHRSSSAGEALSDQEIHMRLNSYLASTPPDSDNYHSGDSVDMNLDLGLEEEIEPDFAALIDLDAAGDVWALEDEALQGAMQGESSGFAMDVNWMNGLNEEVAVPA
ncbi:fungal-specific transcription factor domain-containing protein [Neohortaea acidophila]|uniref:Fungal-specific transcription factor domain-containing protein n=1 Tax=Neohortaea acidophila TaxID=245834 RepID=A0A6A6PXB6_9PEZI|nr:fungal-specific transcription factor domain-containing protein [Neohortaea acidophila]KAF2484401.1 fungal-specific transcription factor domain-containing protein [Neohortaea acidophila]